MDGQNGEKITFILAVLNVGGGFDWNSQLFRALYDGIYFFFTISRSKTISLDHIQAYIGIAINNEHIGEALSSSKTTYGGFSQYIVVFLSVHKETQS